MTVASQAGSFPSGEPKVRPATVAVGAVLLAWLSSAPATQLARVFDGPPVAGSAAYAFGIVAPCMFAVGLFLRSCDVVAARNQRAPFVLLGLLAAWVLMSSFWSASPDLSANEALLFSSVCAGGLWFGGHLSGREQLSAIAWGFQPLVMISLLLGATSESGRGLGGWTGVFASRNTLGPIALLAAMAVSVSLWRSATWRPVGIALGALDVLCAVFAGARTPAVAAGIACASGGAAWWAHRRSLHHRRWLVTLSGSLVLGTMAAVLAVASSERHSMALSARPAVWRHALDSMRGHWLQGFGYRAFWLDKTFMDPLYLRTGLVFDNAHNTAIEVLVGAGVVGGGLAVAVMVLAVSRALLNNSGNDPLLRMALGAIAVFAVIENMTEAFVVYQSSVWLLVCAACAGAGSKAAPAVAVGASDPLSTHDESIR